MKNIVFIYGGVRSGKSTYAVNFAEQSHKNVTLIATTVFSDDEMKERIEKHKKSRPEHWKVFEEGKDLIPVLNSVHNEEDLIIIDCLGVWVSNLLLADLDDRSIEDSIDDFVKALTEINYNVVIVSNEVGYGVVPPSSLGRRFRDLLGTANQRIAKISNEVILMQVGIPVKIK